MKQLIFLCGPNGIGKTTVCHELLRILPRSAYVDSDACRLINPFALTDETIPTIARNISDLIGNYLDCPAVDTVLFSYGFHGRRKEVFGRVMQALQRRTFRFVPLLLACEEEENIRRMRADGRDEARIRRAVEQSRAVYDGVPYRRIDTTGLTVTQTAQRVIQAAEEANGTKSAYRVEAMTENYANAIARWAYPEPYARYSFTPDEETMAELVNGEYVACVEASGELAGYFCFGASARIPTTAQNVYEGDALDAGWGMRPDLCGQGRSGEFLQCAIAYARAKYGAGPLRLTVAGFNARAIRAYEKAGFILYRKVFHARSGDAYYVMRLDGGNQNAGDA